MKKIKKLDLRLEKEVISSLTTNDLSGVKGGANSDNPGEGYASCAILSYADGRPCMAETTNFKTRVPLDTCWGCPDSNLCITLTGKPCKPIEPISMQPLNCNSIYVNGCPTA